MPAGSGWVKVVLGMLGIALHVLDVIAEGRAGARAAEAERAARRHRRAQSGEQDDRPRE